MVSSKLARHRLLAAAALAVAISGCASPAAARRPTSGGVDAAVDHWVSAEAPQAGAEGLATRRPITLAPVMMGPTTIHAPPSAPERPRHGGHVDVRFQRADLGNALQFLADAGRFNLVLEGGMSGQVSATLHDVDAYDALVMLAEANGAQVRYERQIVLVRHR